MRYKFERGLSYFKLFYISKEQGSLVFTRRIHDWENFMAASTKSAIPISIRDIACVQRVTQGSGNQRLLDRPGRSQ